MNVIHKLRYLWIAFLLILLLSFIACTKHDDGFDASKNKLSERNLKIVLNTTADHSIGSEFSSDELGGNFSQNLIYQRVYDVSIEINDQQEDLAEALKNNHITEEDIFYYARLDARAGICKHSAESTNGVTSYFFDYPEYNLRLIYDLLETPDGKQHQISSMFLTPPGETHYSPYIFYDEHGIRYDIEDWGLEFTVQSASPTSITIQTTQTGGQQIGQLKITNYILATNSEHRKRIDKNPEHATYYNDFLPIKMNGSDEIIIDWSEYYGELPSGNHEIAFYIRDVYDDSIVHPLMVDYMNYWVYIVEFTIP